MPNSPGQIDKKQIKQSLHDWAYGINQCHFLNNAGVNILNLKIHKRRREVTYDFLLFIEDTQERQNGLKADLDWIIESMVKRKGRKGEIGVARIIAPPRE